MGTFSWLTADTRQSIAIAGPQRYISDRPVYLLRPKGEAVAEYAYEGYGVFGGINAYDELAWYNLPEDVYQRLTAEDRYAIGVSIECGSLLRHDNTQNFYSVFHDVPKALRYALPVDNITHLPKTWNEPCPEFGNLSSNEAVEMGLVREVNMSDLLDSNYKPLKFSFNNNAQWHALPKSERCPYQGQYYD